MPDFDDNEGVYFKNVDAFLPLGTLHYQTITLDALRDGSGNAAGDFVIELTRIPNTSVIYEDFYCDGACNIVGGEIQNPNEGTRGYVRWGDFSGVNIGTGVGLPGPNDTDNGIYFVSPPTGGSAPSPSDVTNIGISRIEGMRIHHMKITTLGAN